MRMLLGMAEEEAVAVATPTGTGCSMLKFNLRKAILTNAAANLIRLLEDRAKEYYNIQIRTFSVKAGRRVNVLNRVLR